MLGSTTATELLQSKLKMPLHDPKPTGYTFTDEMWRTRTQHNPRLQLQDGKPYLAVQKYEGDIIPPTPPRTAAQRACVEDEKLWESSSSLNDYEERKRALYERRRAEREEWMARQPTFHVFLSLPPELRLQIWRLAMAEPKEVQFLVSKWIPAPIGAGWSGAVPLQLQAVALFPPLMLVNRESNGLASAHYRRAFRGMHGAGGVLTAYPTILRVDKYPDSTDALTSLPSNDLDLIEGLTFQLDWKTFHDAICRTQKVLEAGCLKRIVIDTDWPWKNGPPNFGFHLREFIEATVPTSKLDLIEFEIKLKNFCVPTPGTQRSYYFRGGLRDLSSV